MKAKFWIFAGPNGARKSTLAALVEAGRIAIAQREAHLASGDSFGVETTFTGHSELELMRRAAAAGYRVTLVFVDLDDVQLSASRVQDRVRRGGHNVPFADLLRRFDRSMSNLALGLKIADRSYVIDNSEKRRRLLLSRENGRVKHLAKVMPAWAANAIPSELRHPIASG